jgi:hypothetical protein
MTKVLARQKEFQSELEKQVSTPVYDIVLLKVISPLASP